MTLEEILQDMNKNLEQAKNVDTSKLDNYRKGVTQGRICELGIYRDKIAAILAKGEG